jgi:hypothetical protein
MTAPGARPDRLMKRAEDASGQHPVAEPEAQTRRQLKVSREEDERVESGARELRLLLRLLDAEQADLRLEQGDFATKTLGFFGGAGRLYLPRQLDKSPVLLLRLLAHLLLRGQSLSGALALVGLFLRQTSLAERLQLFVGHDTAAH